MALQLPQRGQPMDYSYLYQLVEQVNSLSAELARSKTSNYFNNDNPGQTRDTLSAADTKIVATTLKFSDNIKNTSDKVTKTIPFDSSGFLYPPIVTVTPQVAETGNNTDLGKDVTVVITAVTANSVTVQVNYNLGKKQDVTVRLNVIAVGVRK